MRRPVIGITAAVERAGWAVWQDLDANVSPCTYANGVAEARGLPVILPPSDPATEAPEELLERLDGVLLAGGSDIDPACYGAEPDSHTSNWRLERDRFELALAHEALARDLPLLGVCRGMQLLNVACGGTLDQHLAGIERHMRTPGRFTEHEVVVEPGTLAGRAAGRRRLAVCSHHHQGIGRLGQGLIASARAEPDGAIEAIELPSRRWALGILWHAEEMRGSPMLAAFVAAAGRSSFVGRRSEAPA